MHIYIIPSKCITCCFGTSTQIMSLPDWFWDLFILRLLSFPRTLHGTRACSFEPVKPLLLWQHFTWWSWVMECFCLPVSQKSSKWEAALSLVMQANTLFLQISNGLWDKADSNNLSKLRPIRTLTLSYNLTFKSLEQQQSNFISCMAETASEIRYSWIVTMGSLHLWFS